MLDTRNIAANYNRGKNESRVPEELEEVDRKLDIKTGFSYI